MIPKTGARAPPGYQHPAWLGSGRLLIKFCWPRTLCICRGEDTATLMGTPHSGLFPLDNAICQPQQAGAIPRQSEHNKCLSVLLTKLKFVIFRRSVRTNECLRLIAPSLLTDILLISKSSVIFGLSITPVSSEVKFWGCNQCLRQAGWSCTKVMAKHCWERKKTLTPTGVCSLFTLQFPDVAPRAGCLPGASQSLCQLQQDQRPVDANFLYSGKYCRFLTSISAYLLVHYESTQDTNKPSYHQHYIHKGINNAQGDTCLTGKPPDLAISTWNYLSTDVFSRIY